MEGSILFIGLAAFFAIAVYLGWKAYQKYKDNPPKFWKK